MNDNGIKRTIPTIQKFTLEAIGDITVINRDGHPWFIAKEVAGDMGYSNTREAIRDNVEPGDVDILKPGDIKGSQKSLPATFEIPNRGITIINESGLYSLILRSNLDKSRPFRLYVTSSVLPSLRKNGLVVDETMLANLEILNNSYKELKQEKISKAAADGEYIDEKLVEEARDKINGLLDRSLVETQRAYKLGKLVEHTKGSCTIPVLSRYISTMGYPIGQNELYAWLRDNEFLCVQKKQRNLPRQEHIQNGLFTVCKDFVYQDGERYNSSSVLVTPYGQSIIIEQYTRWHDRQTMDEPSRDAAGRMILTAAPGSLNEIFQFAHERGDLKRVWREHAKDMI